MLWWAKTRRANWGVVLRGGRRSVGTLGIGLIAAATAGCSNVEGHGETVRSQSAALTKPGLVAAYGFDEGSGSAVVDATGNGHDTSLDGQDRVSGAYGGGLTFDENKLTV